MISARTIETRLLVAAVVLCGLACGGSRDAQTRDARPPLRDVTSLGRLHEPLLVEASGVVASTRVPNTFWSQNDSGNDAILFAYDSTGAALGKLPVAGAKNRDWEAIVIGPCADGACLFIGDVGDNAGRRDQLTIWRIPEPLPTDTVTPIAEALRFRYEDGPHDVEAMWIGPDSSILLLTKRPLVNPAGQRRWSLVYRLAPTAWRAQGRAVATLVDSIPLVPTPSKPTEWITDASLSPPDSAGARQLAVRTYADVFIFDTDSRTGRPTVLRQRCSLRVLREDFGEGVTWLADHRLLFVAEGRSAVLHTGRCP